MLRGAAELLQQSPVRRLRLAVRRVARLLGSSLLRMASARSAEPSQSAEKERSVIWPALAPALRLCLGSAVAELAVPTSGPFAGGQANLCRHCLGALAGAFEPCGQLSAAVQLASHEASCLCKI